MNMNITILGIDGWQKVQHEPRVPIIASIFNNTMLLHSTPYHHFNHYG